MRRLLLLLARGGAADRAVGAARFARGAAAVLRVVHEREGDAEGLAREGEGPRERGGV